MHFLSESMPDWICKLSSWHDNQVEDSLHSEASEECACAVVKTAITAGAYVTVHKCLQDAPGMEDWQGCPDYMGIIAWLDIEGSTQRRCLCYHLQPERHTQYHQSRLRAFEGVQQ